MTFIANNENDALLELAKGKRTTDKARHFGLGIFFASKVFDDFQITSNGITFSSNPGINKPKTSRTKFSTIVYMCLAHNSGREMKAVFDEFLT